MNVARTISVMLFGLVLSAMISGCASSAPSADAPAAQIEATTPADAAVDATEAEVPDDSAHVSVERPAVDAAEAAVLEIASTTYPQAQWNSVSVTGMGLDGSGVWWIQAWTSTGREGDESEQWFVTYDGASWTYENSGTGTEREDHPSDIAWEDVE